jgi:hypothetical protein
MVTAMVAPATRDELDAVADVMGRVATTLEGMRAELKG